MAVWLSVARHGEVFRYKHSGSSGSSSWILWGPNSSKKSQKSKPSQKCCSVLLASVIFLVLLLVITIAALAIYMGALRIDSQHLELIFDSSFRVTAGDSYNPSLENSTSNLYKEKSKRYKSMIEKLYNASVLSPAIKYCGVIGFKNGSLIVFYRIILDRRKIPRSIGNVEEVVKNILVDEITSRKAVAFKNIKVDENDIHIKRYFGVSLASLTNKEDNVSSEVQSEDFTSSSNLDDTNRIVTLQSHSSSPDTPRPSSPNSKRKYSTSHIQRKVTPNSDPSSLETETTLLDMHTSTVPPNKAVFGSFTILDKPHFGDVFTSVATSKPPLENINEKIRITPSTNQPRKRTSPIANKHAGLIETANDEPVFRETDLDDKMLRHSPLESFAHNSLLDMYKPMMEEDEEIKTKSQPISKPEAAMPKEEISGVGEAQVIVLPAASSSHELLLSPHGTLHSKPTTFRPHTYTKSRQTTQHSVPPEIVVTTEARKATPSSVHGSSPKQKPNRNEVQKQILILKEKPAVMNQNLVPNRRKDEISTTNKNSQLIHGPSVSIQRHTDDYDSELKSISSFLKSEFPVLQKIGNLDEVLKAYKANRTMSSIQKKNDFVSSETAFNGDLAIMESSNEYQYAHTIRTPGNRHSPVVTLLPVRSNVGPGKPLRPRPYLECEMNSSFRCGNGECVSIGSKCNQLVDCADGSDEKNCSCADFLKSQFLTRKICDGIIDCWDFSDEYECEWCSPGQYICPNSRVCIERTRLCDGIKDCPLGDDEKQCINLFPIETRSPSSTYLRNAMQGRSDVPIRVHQRTDNNPKHVLQDGEDSYLQNTLYPVYHDSGFLMIQKQGQWGKLCMNQINNFIMKTLKWKISDLGKAICKSMTFRDLNEIEAVADPSTDDSIYYELSMNAINSSAATKSALLFQKTKCSQKQVVAVNCSSLECGIRPQANNIWGSVNLTRSMRHSRIVGGGNARLGSWPWQAALYKEGEFQCGATLISDQWLLSAGHCFYRAQDDYWVARLGTLRRGTKLPSPYEQLRPISKIILHPQYVDAGFINDISILKMKTPVQFSNYVRPICLPHPNTPLTDGTLCTVVGWGQLFEIGRVFPDTLQEVQLPIISTAECRKRTLFLPLYRVTENMFCAGFERGGRDACLGDSGGPLMCQEPDGRWSLMGVTSNGYGCARANRPGVYTKVSNYIPWLYNNMAASEYNMMRNETQMSRQHVCNGHRCPLGECLPKARVCNGYMECSDGSDEQGCW
ncbi:hypothetical protein M8J76_016770 [Diaphorina citri]|nr:hypothetical protein M8J76_016770 [Diaphorina citri]KAI5754041.1 hypothetical protein M8J77_005294 [Diaphorina citri]